MWELCGKAGVNSVTLCRPLPYGLHVAPVERGWRNPRKRCRCLPRARTEQRRDIRPVERVSSVTSGPVRPSPSLATIPDTAAPSPELREPGTTRHRTPAAVHPPAFRQLHPRVSVRTTTKREAPTQPPSKPLLGGYRTRHDARQEQDSPGQSSTSRHCAPCRHM
jgi:hypothetical protein